MQNLSSGMAVLPAGRKRDCIELSEGTAQAPRAIGGVSYQTGACIPRNAWRRPSAAENRVLLGATHSARSEGRVNVVRIPHGLLKPFHDLRAAVNERRSMDDLLKLASTPSCKAGVDLVIEHVRQRFQIATARGEHITGGISVRPPSLPTITVHPQNRMLVGLHLDNWYRLPLENRHESPNRFGLNIGCQDRFFLFFNISIRQMHEAVKARTAEPMPSMMLVGQFFMNLFPAYPVIRLRVRPGEAYVAPTENLIHDASSIEMSVADISLSLLGRFESSSRKSGDSSISAPERVSPVSERAV